MFEVSEPSDNAICGCVEEAIWSVKRGVVVPSPKNPLPVPCAEYAELVTAPNAVADERNWSSVAEPAGVPAHVLLIA